MSRNMKQLLQQMICLCLAILLLAGCGGTQIESTTTPAPLSPTPTLTPVPTPKRILDGKRALFVLYQQFEEQEYGKPRMILEDKGVSITVASSSSRSVLVGHRGMEVQMDINLKDVHVSDYDIIVFIGGYAYNKNDPEAQRIAQEAVAEGKLLSAICIAPITLAKAGVINGKRVTASTGISQLEEAGGIFTGNVVERDGLIITANGPYASQKFGEAIAAALEE